MKGIVTILLCLGSICSTAQNKIGAIGQWRGHFDNHSVQNVIKGDAIYAATPYQIAKLDSKGNVLNWIDKTTGLHDINIKNISWNNTLNAIIIVYANSNIDIVQGEQVYNVNAIQLTTIYADKKINTIYQQQNIALLATNFGIVSLDINKHEIKETWLPGTNQQPVITYAVTVAHDSIFAATENGIWAAPYKNNQLTPNAWGPLNLYNHLNIKNLIQKNNLVYAYNANSIFQLPNPTPIVQLSNAILQNIDTSVSNCILNVQYPAQKGAILKLNKDNSLTSIVDSVFLKKPMQTWIENNTIWIADSSAGLGYQSNAFQWIYLGGTNAAIHGNMSINESNLIAPFGDTPGYAAFNTDGWKNFSKIGNVNLPKINASVIVNTDHSYWFSTANELLQVSNEHQQLSSIQPTTFNGAFKDIHEDQNNRIWALQNQLGLVRQLNNTWATIPVPSSLNNNGLSTFILNNQQQAWIIAPSNQGIYIYQSKEIFGNESWKQLTTHPANGNLPSNQVTSIASDLSGSIWVGTDNGIGIFNCGDISSSPCNAYLPIVNNNGFNGYLFQKEIVHTIAVDGANQKWIGTNNGVWLLSNDGLTILEHFNQSNSPLTADTVLQIIVDPSSGEVFMNTSNQMVSYRGKATQGATTQQQIQIFPNPVPPNYNGYVAFRGLVDNAIVKITDLTGKLLYQTTALGGQAVWNIKTSEGQKVATGMYLVFVRDLSGNEAGVGKIIIATGY